jgi:hypothetical protein
MVAGSTISWHTKASNKFFLAGREFSGHILGFKQASSKKFREKTFFQQILKFSRIYSQAFFCLLGELLIKLFRAVLCKKSSLNQIASKTFSSFLKKRIL